MARAYQHVGRLLTQHLEDGWSSVEGADFVLPWGTESPLHLHRDNDYLIRWEESAEGDGAWQLYVRVRST